MAYICKMTDKPRKLPWRGQVRREGIGKMLYKFGATRQEVEDWARDQESSIRRTGQPLTIDTLKKITGVVLIDRYITQELNDDPKEPKTEVGKRLNNIKDRDIFKKGAPYITPKDVKEFFKARQKERWKHPTWKGEAKPITARTVARERNILQVVFETAKDEYPNLTNPFRGVTIEGSDKERERSENTGLVLA